MELNLEEYRSYSQYDDTIHTYFEGRLKYGDWVLDIGAGSGKYWEILKLLTTDIDAIEPTIEYYEKYLINKRYRCLLNMDIEKFMQFSYAKLFMPKYSWVIMGDMLEHLSIDKAREVVNWIKKYGCSILIQVPFEYEQDSDNPYEVHRQADLNEQVMAERYPEFKPLVVDKLGGVYIYEASSSNR